MNTRNPSFATLWLVLLSAAMADAFGVVSDDVKVDVKVEVNNGGDPNLPHYFPPGIVQTQDPLQQFQEIGRCFTATDKRFQPWSGRFMIAGDDSYRFKTGIVSTCTLDRNPFDCEIVLDHYVQQGNRIRVTDGLGQYFITEAQLQIVKDDMVATLNVALDSLFADYQDLVAKVEVACAKALHMPVDELRARLEEKLMDHKDVTFRELLMLPLPIERSDLVPHTLHLGCNPRMRVLGVTWLNAGVVYYNPQARIMDYVMDSPGVLKHELAHNVSKLQEWPLTGAFDAELLASVNEMLLPKDKVSLFYHSYAEDLRELMLVFFGYDVQQAYDEIVISNQGGALIVNSDKYREHFGKLEELKVELRKHINENVLPEFYGNLPYWLSLNHRVGDDSTVFRVIARAHYYPTLLGGAEATMVWVNEHKPEIMADTRAVFDEMGRDSGQPVWIRVSSGRYQPPPALKRLYEVLFSAEERERIAAYVAQHHEVVDEIINKNDEELMQWLRALLMKGEVR